MTRRAPFVTVASLLCATAFADPPPPPRAGSTSSTGAPATPLYQTRTRYDFDDDVVEGETFTPDGVVVHGNRHPTFDSMIRPRQNFLPEMLRAAEDL